MFLVRPDCHGNVQYRLILFLQLIWTSRQTVSVRLVLWSLKPTQKHPNALKKENTSAVSVTKVSKAPNCSESTFFFTRRVLKCLSSAQLAVKASATSYPKGNISLNIELNESSNAMVACGVSLRCQRSKNIPVAGLVVLTKLQKNMAMHQDLLNATSVTRPLLERIHFLIICRFTPK